jgi:hypothetical protein
MGQQGQRPEYFRQSLVGNMNVAPATKLISGPTHLTRTGPSADGTLTHAPTPNPINIKYN